MQIVESLDRFIKKPKKGFQLKPMTWNPYPTVELIADFFRNEQKRSERIDFCEVLLEALPGVAIWQLISRVATITGIYRPRVEDYFKKAAERLGRVWG